MKTMWEAIKQAAQDFGDDNHVWVDPRVAQLLALDYKEAEVQPEVAYAIAYQHFMSVGETL